MAKDLITMCCECRRIKIGDDLWIGREHPFYAVLSQRQNISDGYCPEHLNNNQLNNHLRSNIYRKIENALF